MRISDWSSDVCSSDLELHALDRRLARVRGDADERVVDAVAIGIIADRAGNLDVLVIRPEAVERDGDAAAEQRRLPADLVGGDAFRVEREEIVDVRIITPGPAHAVAVEIGRGDAAAARIEAAIGRPPCRARGCQYG